ncbi:hypothetical protein BH10ACT3_BH10ACT3_12930 [soil metagenome]
MAALLAVIPLASVGCSSSGETETMCGERSLPVNAVPVPEPFVRVSTRSVKPSSCGGLFRRYAVLNGTAPTLELLTEDYVRKIVDTGWRKASCAKAHTFCFRNAAEELFLALLPIDGAAAPRDGFPAPEDDGPQLLVAVSPSASTDD